MPAIVNCFLPDEPQGLKRCGTVRRQFLGSYVTYLRDSSKKERKKEKKRKMQKESDNRRFKVTVTRV